MAYCDILLVLIALAVLLAPAPFSVMTLCGSGELTSNCGARPALTWKSSTAFHNINQRDGRSSSQIPQAWKNICQVAWYYPVKVQIGCKLGL
jgi:hypothetical protein